MLFISDIGRAESNTVAGAIGLDNKKSSDSSTMYGAANSKIRGKQDDDGDLDL